MSVRVASTRLQVLQIYRLLQYIHQNDRVHIEKMLELGVEDLINVTEPRHGRGVLHVAVAANNDELVNFFVGQGALPNIQDKLGRTPLMVAAELGNHNLVEVLVKNQADLKAQDAEGKGVLFYCLHPTEQHELCLQLVLEHEADVNNVSSGGTHVFLKMCEKAPESASMCIIMLEAGTDPNASDQDSGMTALMVAAKAGCVELVRAILRKGGDPNAVDQNNLTVVHYAAMGGFFEVIQVLSAFSADMGASDVEGCTPLHHAAAQGSANCCKFLAQRGCNSRMKNKKGLLPRQVAKDAGNKAALKELKKAEKLQDEQSKSTDFSILSEPWTVTLHDWSQEYEADLREAFGDESETVTSQKFVSVLEQLKAPVGQEQINAIISIHDRDGSRNVNITDFIKGIKYMKKQFLLAAFLPKPKKGGKGGKKGKKGKGKKGKFVMPFPICTLPPERIPRRKDGGLPLFMIETSDSLADVRRFKREKPKHPIQNDTAWYVDKPERSYVNINSCVNGGDLESVNQAFTTGTPVDVQDNFYKTPLMVACSSGKREVAESLLENGADVNACDQFFWTPLHHAAHKGQVELVELLLKAGAAIDSTALSGSTPLMMAIKSSKFACVDFLITAGANVNAENKKAQNCLEIAKSFADTRIADLVKNKMDSLQAAMA